MELSGKQLMQPKNFCNAEEGRGDSSDHRPSRFALAQTALSESSSLALCTDEGGAEYREEERTYCKGNGK